MLIKVLTIWIVDLVSLFGNLRDSFLKHIVVIPPRASLLND